MGAALSTRFDCLRILSPSLSDLRDLRGEFLCLDDKRSVRSLDREVAKVSE